MFAAVDAYDRYVGRYSPSLARETIVRLGIERGNRVLDVGCGPGALTSQLVGVVGAENVAGVDPSEAFVATYRERYPGVQVHVTGAEQLPFEEASFDFTIAQLVLHFMKEPLRGVSEMRRVTRSGGKLAASVWDYGDKMTLIRKFWDAARAIDPAARAGDEVNFLYTTQTGLAELWEERGLKQVSVEPVDVSASYTDFEDLWWPLEAGVGPAGAYAAALAPEQRARLKDEFRGQLGIGAGDTPFELTARAWLATGTN
jgi:SAM-dependent methyltransferase